MKLFDKHPEFIVREMDPFNSGPPLKVLRQEFITPNQVYFVRNHGSVPEIDPAVFRLGVNGLLENPLVFSLDEIRNRFHKTTVVATLQCAGNRRSELAEIAPFPGELSWGAEAISNAVWGGARLKDVLEAAGIKPEAQHVAFTGLDEVQRKGRKFGFGGSIPLVKAFNPEVILAYEMNGEPLTPVHGFPLRVVVPGYIGARSVKWLSEITVQKEPSDNYFQGQAYKLFPPHVNHQTVEWANGLMLGELSVNAVICEPAEGEAISAGLATVRGYAITSGGRHIARVDVSIDDGDHWMTADLLDEEQSPWAWRFWEVQLELPVGPTRIVARAWDSAANTQPENIEKIWNFKGYMNNAWHRVKVDCR